MCHFSVHFGNIDDSFIKGSNLIVSQPCDSPGASQQQHRSSVQSPDIRRCWKVRRCLRVQIQRFGASARSNGSCEGDKRRQGRHCGGGGGGGAVLVGERGKETAHARR